MKCVVMKRDGAKAIRVSNADAKSLVETGKYNYTSKGRWKSDGRKR